MKKIILSLGFAAFAFGVNAQVKIKDGTVGGTSTVPNANSILDLESSTKGLHLPRVSLLATNNPKPLNEAVFSTLDSGLVVYNFATAGTAPYNVTPGVYYCDGTQWVRAANKPDWLIFGNATAAVNGTPAGSTDSQYVMGRVGIGLNSMQRLYATTAGGDSAHKFAYLAVNGEASINRLTVGMGGGQVGTNTAVGVNALNANTTGYQNLAVGVNTLMANTTGNTNIALGGFALTANTTGYSNTAVGYSALQANTTGGLNTALGYSALYTNTTGSNNTAQGSYALYSNTTGNNNTAVGYNALFANTSGTNNTAQGYLALNSDTSGSYNTAVGNYALAFNTSGNNNTAQGYWALYNNTTGNNNTAQGYLTLFRNTTGSNNAAQGYQTLLTNTTGSYNTAQGYQTLYNDSTGNYNIALGYQAGYTQTSGNRNIAIGYNTNFPNTAGNYQLNIGNVIWGTGVDSTPANAANIGINTSAPNSSFQVNGSVSTNINVQSGDYGLTPTDYTVVFTGGGAVTATLPPATGISGRMYRIVASGDGTTVTVFSASGTVMLLSTITTLTGQSAIFQSDGNTWYQVQ